MSLATFQIHLYRGWQVSPWRNDGRGYFRLCQARQLSKEEGEINQMPLIFFLSDIAESYRGATIPVHRRVWK